MHTIYIDIYHPDCKNSKERARENIRSFSMPAFRTDHSNGPRVHLNRHSHPDTYAAQLQPAISFMPQTADFYYFELARRVNKRLLLFFLLLEAVDHLGVHCVSSTFSCGNRRRGVEKSFSTRDKCNSFVKCEISVGDLASESFIH